MSLALRTAALLLLGACGPATRDEPAVSAGAWLLPGTEWRLVEIDGAPAPAPVVATLTTDGRITGQAPCNRFKAAYSGRWPELTFAPAAVTRTACPELVAETAFFAALEAVNRAAIGDDGLAFSDATGVRLRFQRF